MALLALRRLETNGAIAVAWRRLLAHGFVRIWLVTSVEYICGHISKVYFQLPGVITYAGVV